MSDFDTNEKLNVLLKSAFAVTSTNENTPWYNETIVPFNNYVEAEDILTSNIPVTPNFNTDKEPSDYGLKYSDFYGGDDSSESMGSGKIQEDSTGTVVKFTKLKLEAVLDKSSQSRISSSYYKIGTINDASTNLLQNSFQFTKHAKDDGSQPYQYTVWKNDSTGTNKISKDSTGGNYFFDYKSGIIFFPDYNLVQGFVSPSTPPLFTFVKYIGGKGLSGGVSGTKGSQGFTGPQGLTGFTGFQGFTGVQGFTGHQGFTGFQGFTGYGPQGFTGVRGLTGYQGHQGEDGGFGGQTFNYKYDSSTSTGQPSSGKIRTNQNSLLTSTKIYMNSTDDNSIGIASFMQTVKAVSSGVKGFIKVTKQSSMDKFMVYNISDLSDNSGY